MIANRLKFPPIVGYLDAGILVGPYTPGFTADGDLAAELAEIGVILLMFGVGLHFSYKDLFAVRKIAIPGAVAQIVVATLMGMALAWTMGWPLAGGLVFGLALSVASTVVLLRARSKSGSCAHLDEEVEHLTTSGADRVIMGEREIARQMLADVAPSPA